MKDTLRDTAPSAETYAATHTIADPTASTTTASAPQAQAQAHTTQTPGVSGLPTASSTPHSSHTTTSTNAAAAAAVAPSQAYASGVGLDTGNLPTKAHNISGDGAAHSTTIHEPGTGSVVDRLNANVQASVKEATHGTRTDPDVAKDLGHVPAGKQFLEGLGLGGDERKTTLRNVRE